jgi:ribosomal-protein-alanine N-acetyltransferase
MTNQRPIVFLTTRLAAREWHSVPPDEVAGKALHEWVSVLMTARTTNPLPESWRGDYSEERATAWIDELDREAIVLMAINRSEPQPIGFLILYAGENQAISDAPEIRIGYVIGEQYWGKGVATELVAGFVDWCREIGLRTRLIAGVSDDNEASKRVLVKVGFHADDAERTRSSKQLFRLEIG